MPDNTSSVMPGSGPYVDPQQAKLAERLRLWDSDRAALIAQVAMPAVYDIVAAHLWEMAERYRANEDNVQDWDPAEWLESEAGALEGIAGTWGQP